MWGLILITLNALFITPARSDPRVSVGGMFCSPDVYSPESGVMPNFAAAMRAVTDLVKRSRWGQWNVTSPPPEVRVFGQCHEDLKPADCTTCMKVARSMISQCLPSVSGAVYLNGCLLRYYGASTAGIVSQSGHLRCSNTGGAPEVVEAMAEDKFIRALFANKVRGLMSLVMTEAARYEGKFGAVMSNGGVVDVSLLGQCWITTEQGSCNRCLTTAGERLYKECAASEGATDGTVMYEDCYMRYTTVKIFDDGIEQAIRAERARIIIAGVLSATVLAIFATIGVYYGYRRISKKKFANHNNISNLNLNFKYDILEKATGFFDSSRRLGQGGSGSVFKGILPDGKIVAVKRLFFSTRQWVDEFFNEVNLINGIEHKNLVKLLGCSIEGPESLLVYEFVPNRSLDLILFDKFAITLPWQQRVEIISGTAEGLAYLHGGSGVKIIHRDVKASNILLGDNFSPKIADFGLVRSVAQDKSHISTGIAGTLGYMAPEYIVRGQLTEKADVYAFGVLVLEIVCGRRNSAFTLGSSSVLHSVWKLYTEDKIVEAVDLSLRGNFDVQEASNVLQIGLLCTQASGALRPSMSEVIQMLKKDTEHRIPTPRQPPFLNSRILAEADESLYNSSEQTQSEISCSFTVNSSTNYESSCQYYTVAVG